MDFHSLTRRELQALCKKNKIPANLTNLAMADALHSLHFVDGIEEILKPCESETANSLMESPGKSETVTSVPRTGRRTTHKTIKHDSETLQATTRRTRGTVVRGVVEAKNDMLETPALPTNRRRAAATSVQAKLESMMKECEPKERIIGEQIEGERKDVPKTPAAVLTSQRKHVKAKSSVRPVYSTRRSARLAGNQEGNTQENEMSGSITFDAFSGETDENLEVDSEQCSIHKNEELTKNGAEYMNTSGSLEINNQPNIVTGQDSAMKEGVQQESDSNLVVVALDANAEEVSEEVAHDIGSEDVHISEKKVAENEKEMASGGTQCLEHVSEAKIEVAGEELMEESEVNHAEANVDSATDALEVSGEKQPIKESEFDLAEVNVDSAADANVDGAAHDQEVASEEEPMEECDVVVVGGEELMEESEVDHAVANVDGVELSQGVAGEEEPMEDYDVDHTEANGHSATYALEDTKVEEPMEESDHAEANGHSATYAPEDTKVEEPMEESDHAEANVDSSTYALEDTKVEEPMEESDHAEANVKELSSKPLEKSSAMSNIGQVQVSDDKENINNFGKNLHDLSLRKLTKMLKELQITKDPSGNEIVKIKAPSSRSALQALPEN